MTVRGAAVHALVFLILFTVELALQWGGGAFSSEFGGSPDEPAHVVTGLMVRDYLASLPWTNPVTFATDFYIHYPKVAIGHWPPLFYIVEAIWMLIFSASFASIVVLIGFLTTLLAMGVYLLTCRHFPQLMGLAAGLLLLLLPLVQAYGNMVMTEIPVAVLSFGAVVCFARYLETKKWEFSAAFGVLAAMSILTKGTGMALCLVPPITLALWRRYEIVKRPSFWLSPLIVALLCAPFYLYTLPMVQNGWAQPLPNLHFFQSAVPYYSAGLVRALGPVVSLLAVVGVLVRVAGPSMRSSAAPIWCGLAALALSVWIFQCLVPCGLDYRHLLTAVPALIVLAAAGAMAIVTKLGCLRAPLVWKSGFALCALGSIALFNDMGIRQKSFRGFGAAVEHLVSNPQFRNSIILISSDPTGEGVFVAEVAMREKRTGHIVLRASKVLSRSRWDGSDYELLYEGPDQLMRLLETQPVGLVAVDRSVGSSVPSDMKLLRETIVRFRQKWSLLGTFDIVRKGTLYKGMLEIYSLKGHESRSINPVEIDMKHMLERTIELTPVSPN